jgi:hypothetical protein
VLSLEREQDANTYAVDLRGVLDRRAVRSHLRAAVLAWLTDLRSLRDEELDPVLDTAVNREDRLRWEAVRTLSSEPFARALNDHGLLPIASDLIPPRIAAAPRMGGSWLTCSEEVPVRAGLLAAPVLASGLTRPGRL